MNAKLGVFLICSAGAQCIWGQPNAGFGGGTGSSAGGSAVSGSPSTLTITGTVKVDDGSPLPGSVGIQVVCGGVSRQVARTTGMDDFGFQMTNLKDTGSAGIQAAFRSLSGVNADASSGIWMGHSQGGSCDLRADLPGYDSTLVNLNNAIASTGTSVGVLWLHRIQGKHEGNVVNISTLKAPKEALKKFNRGSDFLRAGKLQDAVASFAEAVRIDPGFAEAWSNLSRCQYGMRASGAAKTSAQRAVELDPKMAGAWQVLGYIASDQEDWADAVRNLEMAERLDPANSALPWFVSAVAYYRMHKYADAERSIQRELKLDVHDQYPRSQYLLGLILIARQDMERGTEALRNYLAGSPDPRDIATAKALLNAPPTTVALK